jgi:hypothetical protein
MKVVIPKISIYSGDKTVCAVPSGSLPVPMLVLPLLNLDVTAEGVAVVGNQ